MCGPILRSMVTKLTNLENMQKNRVLFDVTWRNNGTSYVVCPFAALWYIFRSGTFWDQPEVATTSGSKVMAQAVVFHVFGDLDLWPMFYFCHTHWAWCTGISMRCFIRIRPVLMGDIPLPKTTNASYMTVIEVLSTSIFREWYKSK